MNSNSRWEPGDHIALRGVWRQRLWVACPVTVVRDTAALIALYWRAGTPVKIPGKWKDEDDFREAAAIGVFSTEEVHAIRAEGERAIKLMQANQPPFCDGWEQWLPPAEWEIPELPAGWDNIDAGVR